MLGKVRKLGEEWNNDEKRCERSEERLKNGTRMVDVAE